MEKRLIVRLNSLSALASLACAVHCLLTPLLIGILPLIGLGMMLNKTVEITVMAVAIVIAAFSLFLGYRQHRKARAILLFVSAAIMISTGMLITPGYVHPLAHAPIDHVHQGGILEIAFLAAGALCLAASVMVNRYFCNACHACDSRH